MVYKKVVKLAGISREELDKKLNACKFDHVKSSYVYDNYEATIEFQTDLKDDEGKLCCKAAYSQCCDKFTDFMYSNNPNESLETVLVKTLTKKGLIISTAESCTGGLLAGRIINASGASSVYEQGFITYSNKAKRKHLEVRKETLKKYGAVSKQTAKEMAKGVALVADADAALSTTGIAGPEGGTKEKPVGLVYIGCYYNGKTTVEEHYFTGDRVCVRNSTIACALNLLRRCLSND